MPRFVALESSSDLPATKFSRAARHDERVVPDYEPAVRHTDRQLCATDAVRPRRHGDATGDHVMGTTCWRRSSITVRVPIG